MIFREMDNKNRVRIQLECLYEMFRDKVEENVVYIVYSENEGKIDLTIDQLMSIAACSFTGYDFEPSKLAQDQMMKDQKDPIQSIIDSDIRHVPKSSQGKNTVIVKSSLENDENDAGSSLSINDRIERLQKCIDDLLEEKKFSHDKASHYLSKRMFPVTSYYSDLASQLRKMIETKTNQLVELLLERSDDAKNIDLHGLNPVQARLVVSELLKIREKKLVIDKQGEAKIDIITGWGKHSACLNGQRIKPTIVNLLRDKGYEYQHLNKGALRVTIRR